MPDRSLLDIDEELSLAVKARAAMTASISKLSSAVVAHTGRIDYLLAERSRMITVPTSPAELVP